MRTAVVGVGALGRHHARILSELESVDLVAVVDTNREQGESVAESCGAEWHENYSELYERIDAVSIAVPTVAHFAVASDFLKRGISVLVEKPFAATSAEARQLAELATQKNCTLQVGHIERFNPATALAWDQVGTPKYIRTERVSPYTFRSTDIGAVLDLMIHDIDLVLDLAKSPIASVEAFGVSVFGGHEDTAQARLRFENGCIADLTASRVSPTAARTMQIWSDKGCTNIDFSSREVVSYAPSQQLRDGLHADKDVTPDQRAAMMTSVFGELINVQELQGSDADALTAELAEFANCVQTGATPSVGGTEALAAMNAADLVLAGIAEHNWNPSVVTRPRLRAA